MEKLGKYDPALQMFVDAPREPDLNRLTFIRWMVENRRLEQPIEGPASGELAELATNQGLIKDGLPLANIVQRGSSGRSQFDIGSVPGVANRIGGLIQ